MEKKKIESHFKVVHKPIKRKSRAGVEYTKYKPTLELIGTPSVGKNRKGRRLDAEYERTSAMRKRRLAVRSIADNRADGVARRVKRKQGNAHERALKRKAK